MTNPKSILVLGLGNVLMHDEGAGIEVINWLEGQALPPEVDLVDGGTGGFHLLGMLTGYDQVILIDAALTDDEAGVVKLIQPRFASDFPRVLSTHDIGLRDLIESAYLLEKVPDIWLITISVKDFQEMGLGLSETILAAVPKAGNEVLKLLEKL
ncbi:MAG: hydrogenase maturation protease [Bacteroidales bacterium]